MHDRQRFKTASSAALPLCAILASLAIATACADEATVARRDSAQLAALDSSTALASSAKTVGRPNTKPTNIYASTEIDGLSPAAKSALPRVYVPNSLSASVTVIDESTRRILRTFATGKTP